MLIHNTLRRNRLTQSKIKRSEKGKVNRKEIHVNSGVLFLNFVYVYLSFFSGEANAIVAKAKARAEGIEKVSLALQQQVSAFSSMIQSLPP